MCFLWVLLHQLILQPESMREAGFELTELSFHSRICPLPEKSYDIFEETPRTNPVSLVATYIFFQRGTIQSECISDIYIITGDIVKKIYSFRSEHLRKMFVHGLFLPLQEQHHLPNSRTFDGMEGKCMWP